MSFQTIHEKNKKQSSDSCKKNSSAVISKSVFAALTIAFFTLGTFICSKAIPGEKMASTFFVAFSRGLSFSGFIYGFLYKFIPLLIITLSGFDFLGNLYSGAALSFSAMISGYSVSACFCLAMAENFLLSVLYLIPEGITLITLLSSCVGQRAFRIYCYLRGEIPQKSRAFREYIKHNLFRTGIIFTAYFVRCAVCTLIV